MSRWVATRIRRLGYTRGTKRAQVVARSHGGPSRTGARRFGNLLDEKSEMRYLLREKRVFIFKEEMATEPKFFYFYAT